MAQLLVRNIESAVVRKLRGQAVAQGISVEEAHRRLLRSALLDRRDGPADNIVDYLRAIPPGPTIRFSRSIDRPRAVTF